jgi:hypothetical protein
MNHIEDNAACERRDELISVLYGEVTKNERAQFQQHMQTCATCQAEMRGFGNVRESIGEWKLEALAAMDQSSVTIPAHAPKAKSAGVALREFFDLSPLWLKGATAFAALLFCLFAVIALGRLNKQPPTITSTTKSDAIYTEQEKNEIVRKALDDQKQALLAGLPEKLHETIPVQSKDGSNKKVFRSTQVAKDRRPLTRWEREQLAADLRLLGGSDDDEIELLSDPINR